MICSSAYMLRPHMDRDVGYWTVNCWLRLVGPHSMTYHSYSSSPIRWLLPMLFSRVDARLPVNEQPLENSLRLGAVVYFLQPCACSSIDLRPTRLQNTSPPPNTTQHASAQLSMIILTINGDLIRACRAIAVLFQIPAPRSGFRISPRISSNPRSR